MRTGFRVQVSALVAGMVLSLVAEAAAIEAVKGKPYRLRKEHGPWMIMVASFSEPPPERRTDGMSPQEAADELIFELRSKGIPAYAFEQQEVKEEFETFDRLGRPRVRSLTAQRGSVCVLAGNYQSIEEGTEQGRIAEKTLKFVQKFHPAFLRAEDPEFARVNSQVGSPLRKLRNGGLYLVTPGRPGPLSRAFFTVNPLLSPEELESRKRDPLLLKLNAGSDYSLLSNRGRYTLVVATFQGRKTLPQPGVANYLDAVRKFEVTNTLDLAAQGAWELARALRQGHFVINSDRTGRRQEAFDAYVFHDHYQSVVTVGSFSSPDDPQVRRLQEIFGAKVKTHAQTKQEVLAAEELVLRSVPGDESSQVLGRWMFDPTPRLVEVPRLSR